MNTDRQKTNKSWLLIILIIVAATTIIAQMLVSRYQQKQINACNKQFLLTAQQLIQKKHAADIAQKKTYHNQRYDFSISYPETWFVNETDDVVLISNEQRTNESFALWLKNSGDYSEKFLGYFISVYSKNNIDDWNHYQERQQNDAQKYTEKTEYLLTNGQKITLYVERAVNFKHPQGKYAQMPLPDANAYIEYNNYGIALSVAPNGHDQQIDILKQTLSTIKFDDNLMTKSK
ncbi:MAG: hypothetical protein COY09_01695 [Candidatus Portnoybacteria bacterium CG_4_10_14_0_2_um_filter_39_11]|uniref:Uncharacterized protein n=1 Tax=Candidatus Portnoybacteria bacterium CG_4_10_14_0_2_um_filter_39_11 TaxID=1974797 RepID=A0A2M7UID0_9BACT|nr:MAG: hypothetical protein AUJ33_02745 [Parcubacteria group bacterium CG1_02_40_25]PIZ70995.1 MAG: hypothetical protein COY09_01695 [Candidatus Portnoybacteria bacterium CG_4_10_14_0_2_um_filter_39_11]